MTYSEKFGKYSWYGREGKDGDVVVSTRVRLARNLCDYPFSPRLDATGAKEIIEKVRAVPAFASFEYTDFEVLPKTEAVSLSERHIVSREFAVADGARGLLADTDKGTYIMLCEEDHARIQCIRAGLDLDGAYRTAAEAEDALEGSLRIAYNDKFGYLTHCPTNLGTGMRVSVMLHLPAISAEGGIRSIQNQLTKLGLTVRGMSGEGSGADGCLYQISNQVTLGISEEETLKKLAAVVETLVKRERELRSAITGERLARLRDRVRRALGTLRYAEFMDTAEMIKLYSTVRLGAALGMTDGIGCHVLDEMLLSSMPATVTVSDGAKTASDRDAARAAGIREKLTI